METETITQLYPAKMQTSAFKTTFFNSCEELAKKAADTWGEDRWKRVMVKALEHDDPMAFLRAQFDKTSGLREESQR